MEIRSLSQGDERILDAVAADVFDYELNRDLISEFLANPCHHLVVAIENSTVIGFVSALHYVHPDKDPQMWINEIGVSPRHQSAGVGSSLVHKLREIARTEGCTEMWVLTDRSNPRAMKFYQSLNGKPEDQVMFSFSID